MKKSPKSQFTLFTLVMALLALIVALTVSAKLYGADSSFDAVENQAIASNSNADLLSCRYGVAPVGGNGVEWLDDIGAGWYVTFHTKVIPAPNGAEFTPLIWVQQDKENGAYLPTYSVSPELEDDGLGEKIDAIPGALWIVGNEVDRAYAHQGDTHPEIYAQAYHQVYHYIKDRDPTALVANSGLVEVTPGRLQYLDRMWESYIDRFGEPMPVDVWNMHVYVLSEVNPQGRPNGIASVALGTDLALAMSEGYDPDGEGPLETKDSCPLENVYCISEHDDVGVFAQQVTAMRTWMYEHGQRHKPLILSEFSLLFPYRLDPGGSCWLQDEFGNCFTDSRVVDFTDNTLNYLTSSRSSKIGYPLDDNRLVQQWSWWSVNNSYNGQKTGYISDLVAFDNDLGKLTGLTNVGARYRSWAQAEPLFPNLLPDRVSDAIAFTGESAGTADAILKVTVGNNGNIAATDPFSLTFYADASLTEVIGSTSVPISGSNDPNFPIPGCARRTTTVETTWQDLTPGVHYYWVEVDSDSTIDESNESDNVGSGFVIVDPFERFFPTIRS